MIQLFRTKEKIEHQPAGPACADPDLGGYHAKVEALAEPRHRTRHPAANRRAATTIADQLRSLHYASPPTVGLFAGPHPRLVPCMLHRSDHSPFWLAGLPALMWTDTAEFRNPHYHQPSDTPQTLDYGFMHQVTALLCSALTSPPPLVDRGSGTLRSA